MLRRSLVSIACIAVSGLALSAGHAVAKEPTKAGTLATTFGPSVPADKLADLINQCIPQESCKLVVLTQCYSGDMAQFFTNQPNTAVASAGSPGEVTYYGGYHDDASAALAPGAGRTGFDVHQAGVNGKDARENPIAGGQKALGQFSLEPITDDSEVQSRHVLVYAGQPQATAFGSDFQDTQNIVNNFAGQPNTSVTTVGGTGAGQGFNFSGSEAGLRAALAQIKQEFEEAEDPSREQFILFVTDHGGLTTVACPPVAPILPGEVTSAVLEPLIPGFDFDPIDLFEDPTNTPYVEICIPVGPFAPQPLFAEPLPFDLLPELVPFGSIEVFAYNQAIAAPVVLNDFEYISGDLNPNPDVFPIIGDQPGEFVYIRFPLPEIELVELVLGPGPVVVQVFNNGVAAEFLPIGQFEVNIGNILRPDGEPGTGFQGCNPADVNEDGEITFADVTAFISAFNEGDTETVAQDGDASADTTGDGEITFADVSNFIQAFNAGCP